MAQGRNSLKMLNMATFTQKSWTSEGFGEFWSFEHIESLKTCSKKHVLFSEELRAWCGGGRLTRDRINILFFWFLIWGFSSKNKQYHLYILTCLVFDIHNHADKEKKETVECSTSESGHGSYHYRWVLIYWFVRRSKNGWNLKFMSKRQLVSAKTSGL